MGSRIMPSPPVSGATSSALVACSSSLTRQASIYSLTLDEFQNVINEPGKNFGSMNMDEFLKNIWTAEESQAMAVAMTSGGTGNGEPKTGGIARQPSLHRQGSLTLPRTLSRKTVDEVWRDIYCNSEPTAGGKQQRRQATFGEMTLEDFLMKAGVVREENEAAQMPNRNGNHPSVSSVAGAPVPVVQSPSVDALAVQNLQNAGWFNYARQHQQLLQQAEAAAAFANAAAAKRIGPPPALTLPVYDGFSDTARLRTGPLASSLSLSPAITDSPPIQGKKRGAADSLLEKSLERRQRRMIKNRESAARSRARKQAYTVELEAEVTQLKEENMRLKKQQDLVRQLELVQAPQQPTRVLRRTRSTSW